jgi:hypothetical protein
VAYYDSRLLFRTGSNLINRDNLSRIVRETYDLSLIESDYAKADSTTIYTIGLGTQASEGSDPYQNVDDSSNLKSYFMRRVANDPTSVSDPSFPGIPSSPAYPKGIYLQTPDPDHLLGLFETVALRLKVRLVE